LSLICDREILCSERGYILARLTTGSASSLAEVINFLKNFKMALTLSIFIYGNHTICDILSYNQSLFLSLFILFKIGLNQAELLFLVTKNAETDTRA
jgi:hypothetical protein